VQLRVADYQLGTLSWNFYRYQELFSATKLFSTIMGRCTAATTPSTSKQSISLIS
jgi:hypothetical protein